MNDLLHNNPAAVWLLGFTVWFLGGIVFRVATRRPLLASTLPSATFSESWTSARFGKGLVARLGTARNCMHVQIADGHLLVQPHFPMTLAFIPEIYNLDHRVRLQDIRSVTIVSDGRLKTVEIEYAHPGQSPDMMQILMRKAPSFVQACAQARGVA